MSELAGGILEFLRAEILAPGVNFAVDTELAEAGIDSISIIELCLFIEREYGVRLSDALLTPENLKTVQSLARCVLSHSKDAASQL